MFVLVRTVTYAALTEGKYESRIKEEETDRRPAVQIFFLSSWLPDPFILLNGLMEITGWLAPAAATRAKVRLESISVL